MKINYIIERQIDNMKKSIISVLSALSGAVLGAGIAVKMEGDKLYEAEKMSEKHFTLFQMMNQWVKVKQEGKNVSSYFEKKGYKKIAIYGMSYAGETLMDELKDSSITVMYGIDQDAERIYTDVDVISVDDELEAVDAIVVTAITFFDEIKETLSMKMNCPVLSLEDILYEI